MIIDRSEGEYWVVRTEADSPEVDCEVLVKSERSNVKIEKGEFYEVKITGYEGMDLFGEIATAGQIE